MSPTSSTAEATSPRVESTHPTADGRARPGRVRTLRAVWRTMVILVGTASLGAFLALAWLPTLPFRKSGATWRARIRQRFVRLWGRGMLRVLGVRVRSHGTPFDTGRLIVSNHLSYLDIATLASVLPAVFVSKAEVRRWPFWGPMAAMAGTIFIDRDRKRDSVRVLSEMDQAFGRGDSVVVFPEATSTDGTTIIPFRTSLLASAAASERPVSWMTVSYRTPRAPALARTRVCWWGDMAFLDHFIHLCSLGRIEADVTFGEEAVASHDRKELARALRSRMLTRFRPVDRALDP